MKLLAVLSILGLTSCTTSVRPKKVTEFYETSVMITNKEESSGGTGVIYRSGPTSYILTNRHVCELLTEGGYVNNTKKYEVMAFKKSKVHDICLVAVKQNLKVNTALAEQAPELGSKAFISGHPSLYPHVLSEGYVSEQMKIEIVIDIRACTEEEFKKDPIMCIFQGYPITEQLEAQVVSALIAPGSSGSAVFDEHGKIIGLAFASNSRSLAYALVVPWENVKAFVSIEVKNIPWQFPTKGSKSKTRQNTKTKANTLPFIENEDVHFYDVKRWEQFLNYMEQTQCKK